MDPLLSLAFSSISLELMPNAEGDGAGGDMASTTRASQPSKPVPEPSTPQYPLKKIKQNQIKSELAPRRGWKWLHVGWMTWAVQCCHTPWQDSKSGPSPAEVAAAPGGNGAAPLPASVSPFISLFKHRGHKAQQSLDFTFSPKA